MNQKHKEGEREQFSTPYTLTDLEYDDEDVVARLKELTIQEYSESKFDKDDSNPPYLHIFGKNINGRQVFIKIKTKENTVYKVVCVSFHYAEHKMDLPYAR